MNTFSAAMSLEEITTHRSDEPVYVKLYKHVLKPYRTVWMTIYAFFAVVVPFTLVYHFLIAVDLRGTYTFHTSILPSRLDFKQQFTRKSARLELRMDNNFNKLSENPKLFQNITRSGQSLVFSAYLDDTKNEYKIRAIGVKHRTYINDTYCLVWYKNFNQSDIYTDIYGYVVVPGYIDEHPEVFERSWSQVHFMCPLQDLPTNPYAVSIVTQQQMEPLNFIRIKYTENDPFRNYTVCLHSAFNFRTDMSREIVEWMEMNQLLGANHFVMYNFSSHPKNDEVLKWYHEQGLLTIIQWDLPIYTDVHVIAQVAAMTDCLYRNYYSAKFISHLDLDEYIVPRRPGVTTIPELVAALPQFCAYIARCSVFPVEDGPAESSFEGKDLAGKYLLNTLLIRKRQNFVWGARDRSKIILRTACISAAGIHLIQSYATRIRSETTFELKDALLHHYRHGKPDFSKLGDKIHDDFMLKFAPALIENTAKTWESLEANTSISSVKKNNPLIVLNHLN